MTSEEIKPGDRFEYEINKDVWVAVRNVKDGLTSEKRCWLMRRESDGVEAKLFPLAYPFRRLPADPCPVGSHWSWDDGSSPIVIVARRGTDVDYRYTENDQPRLGPVGLYTRDAEYLVSRARRIEEPKSVVLQKAARVDIAPSFAEPLTPEECRAEASAVVAPRAARTKERVEKLATSVEVGDKIFDPTFLRAGMRVKARFKPDRTLLTYDEQEQRWRCESLLLLGDEYVRKYGVTILALPEAKAPELTGGGPYDGRIQLSLPGDRYDQGLEDGRRFERAAMILAVEKLALADQAAYSRVLRMLKDRA